MSAFENPSAIRGGLSQELFAWRAWKGSGQKPTPHWRQDFEQRRAGSSEFWNHSEAHDAILCSWVSQRHPLVPPLLAFVVLDLIN
jgi:hypothetical protein